MITARRSRKGRWGAGLGVALGALCAGCAQLRLDWLGARRQQPEPPPRAARPSDPVLAETIGSYALLSGATGQRVRGFGVVIGLGENGSGDCPTAIRDYLVERLSLQFAPRGGGRRPPFSAERLIDSPDTAVVEVVGIVPGGAPPGTVFDVRVQAVAGSATRSLEGGLLLPCDLRIFEPAQGRAALIGGRVVARARGPVFTNPFIGQGRSEGPGDPRRGLVLGGGRTLIERSVRLLLLEPSYALARRIERRINERFGQRPQAAEAMSRGYLRLHTPPQYAARPQRFIQLATHLYLPRHPAFYERKLRELAELISSAGRQPEHISLVWEGIGRVAIPQLQPLYAHENPLVRFYAARAGLRLKDAAALAVMGALAADPQHPRRLQAVNELGDCAFPAAAQELLPLLDDQDQEIRIAAYEGLLKHHDSSAIRTRVFPNALDRTQTGLILDLVETDARPLIYIHRSRTPRIALFGTHLPVAPPVFYSHPAERVVLNAAAATDDITLFYRTPLGHRLSQKITVPTRLADLIVALAGLPVRNDADRLRGAGLSYAQVVQVLAALEKDGALPARLVLERQSLSELLGPAEIPQRREADEPQARAAPPAAPDSAQAPPRRPDDQPP